MHRRSILTAVSIMLLTAVSFSASHSQWIENGALIASGSSNQQYQMIVSDGNGGAIITWTDQGGAGGDLYAQRIDALGNKLWPPSGVAICTAAGNQLLRAMISDEAGGAIMIWDDNRNGVDNDIYAQRIDAAGSVLWGTNGMPVATGTGNQDLGRAAPDGAGGIIIAWQDSRSLVDFDIYAQRIDAGGSAMWALNGILVSGQTGDESYADIVSDELGGAIITWIDNRSGTDSDIYAGHVDGAGTLTWGAGGMIVCSFTANQHFPRIVSDGIHGAIIAWRDFRNPTAPDIYAQRISDGGARLWNYDGVPVCLAAGWQMSPPIIEDGHGGAFMVWDDPRGANQDIYVQRIDDSGNVLWTVDGLAARIGVYDDACCPEIVSDGMGGVIVAWEDIRVTGNEDIYAQRIDGDGNIKWQANGIPVCNAANTQYYAKMAPAGPGNTFITWYDSRGGVYDRIYAQRVDNHFGYWGNVAGEISSAGDVSKDQGGKVEVKWNASRLDVFGGRDVTHYSVWRAVQPAMVSAFSAPKSVDPSMIDRDFQGPAYRVERTASGNYYWEWVGNTNAQYFSGYSYAVPTLSDSMAAHPAVHYFEILTHTTDPYIFWTSQPDSAYSVDNLAPAPPQALAGDYSYALGKLTLMWRPNIEPDLARYAVYRDVGASFIPSDLNRIATPTDTMVTDLPYPPEQPYYIKLSALDIHGNESVFAVLPPESVTTPTMITGFESSYKNGYVEVSWTLGDPGVSPGFLIERKASAGGMFAEIRPDIDIDGTRVGFKDDTAARGKTYTYRVSAKDDAAVLKLFETTVTLPSLELALFQNYPNPFRPETMISFELPSAMHVELSVFDAQGRKVAALYNGQKRPGIHHVPFRAGDLSSGVYFYKLKAGSRTMSRKMVIMH